MIVPFGNYVLLRTIPEKAENEGTIVIPREPRHIIYSEVISAGDDCDRVKKGDKVITRSDDPIVLLTEGVSSDMPVRFLILERNIVAMVIDAPEQGSH